MIVFPFVAEIDLPIKESDRATPTLRIRAPTTQEALLKAAQAEAQVVAGELAAIFYIRPDRLGHVVVWQRGMGWCGAAAIPELFSASS